MPIVRYRQETQGPQTDVNAGVRANVDQGGTREATANVKKAKDASELYLAQVRSANELRAVEQVNQLSQGVNDFLDNPETGFMNDQMENALDGAQRAEKFLEEKRNEVTSSLNPEQIEIYDAYSSSIVEGMKSRVNKHTAEETRKYKVKQADSLNANLTEASANAFWDDNTLTKNIKTAEEINKSIANDLGYSKEQTKMFLLQMKSKQTTETIFQTIDSKNLKKAEQQINSRYRNGYLTSEDERRLRQALKSKTDDTGYDDAAYEIYKKANGDPKIYKKLLDKIKGGTERIEIGKRVASLRGKDESLRKNIQEDAFNKALGAVESSRGVGDFDDILTSEQKATLSQEQINALEAMYNGAWARKDSTRLVSALYEDMDNNPHKFINKDLNKPELIRDLTQSTWEKFRRMQLKLKEDINHKDKSLGTFRKAKELVYKQLIPNYGKKLNSKDNEELEKYVYQTQKWYEGFQVTEKRNPTGEEVKDYVDFLQREVVIEKRDGLWGFLFGDKTTEAINIEYNQIPIAKKRALVVYFQKKYPGKTPREKDIVALWQLKKRSDQLKEKNRPVDLGEFQ